jgi:hypothetical protein
MKKLFCIALVLIAVLSISACRQADKVSANLSQEADNFNVARKLTVMNVRTDTILFQMTGNFSIKKESDGDLAVTGENKDGTYYKHFVNLQGGWVTYVVEDLGKTTGINKYQYTINFNPKMMLVATPGYSD